MKTEKSVKYGKKKPKRKKKKQGKKDKKEKKKDKEEPVVEEVVLDAGEEDRITNHEEL